MNQITDLNDLRLFAEVVEHGSFTSAARDLGVQTSKLSRRIRALEEELGVRLLNRTSRSLSLTETGRQFYQHCLALVADPNPKASYGSVVRSDCCTLAYRRSWRATWRRILTSGF